MIRINQIKVPLSHRQEDVLYKAAKILRVPPEKIISWQIVRRSIDARHKPSLWAVYSVDVNVKAEDKVLAGCRSPQVQAVSGVSYSFPEEGTEILRHRPVIIGAGPAGLLCAYLLANHGYRPLLLERGRCVEQRHEDVERFWRDGILDPASNVQFGEGGAGTFSDGKLNTLVKDRSGRNREVLKIFVEAGAPADILYDAKPHIGTDILCNVVKNLRESILEWGGQIRFGAQATDLICKEEPGSGTDRRTCRVSGILINGTEEIQCEVSCSP